MRIIVVGAGEVGFDIARMLSLNGHDVIVVEQDAMRLNDVRERLDVLTIHGNGASATVLEEAGVRDCDMIIAVTTVDEVNIMACMMANRLGVETTVARVRSNEYSNTSAVIRADDLGIDLMIHPEDSAAAEAVRLIRRASATDVLSFADGRLQLVGMRIDGDAPVEGKTIRDIMKESSGITYRIMAIQRGVRTILPRGRETLRKDDQIFVLARAEDVPAVAEIMGKRDRLIQNVMILGGSLVGGKIAWQLSKEEEKRVKLIEPDAQRARRLAEELDGVLVIHGDTTDIDLLTAEGLGDMHAFIAVTDDEESNLVTCLMAKHLGVRKTVALLSKRAYIPISQAIGLNAAINTKLAVSHEILRFLRGKHVLSVATIHGVDAEILEVQADEGATITRGPLKDLGLPQGMLVGAVVGERGIEVATGETYVRTGESVIVFTLPSLTGKVERYFDKR